MKLRQYQDDAVGNVISEWDKVQATLGSAATGAGKTQIYCELVRRRPGRALVLEHRTELVAQAVRRLESFGIGSEIEQGEQQANSSLWGHRVIVATPQTLYTNNFARLKRFNPDHFQTIICDEAHHYCGAPAFEGVVRHFMQNKEARIAGFSATCDRADNVSMARIFQSVAFNIEIKFLIDQGYLVPIDQQMVKIKTLDYSKCTKVAGELSGPDLDRVLEYERNLHGMADATLQIIGSKRTAVFAKTVDQAERMVEIFNRHKSGCADCVFGHTPDKDRQDILKRFGDGSLQICVNVGVLTEGYDNPAIEAVVMARPTLSRALYAQMAGRGTRPLTGVVESVLIDDPETRRKAIAESAKPSLMILDFVGNSGRFKLVSSVDILGGKMSEEAKDRARKKIMEKGSGRILDELELADQELKKEEDARKRSGIKATATFNLHYVDPFDMFKRDVQKWSGYVQHAPLTPKQCAIMVKLGLNPNDYTPEEGGEIIRKHFEASEAQIRALVRAGYSRQEVAALKKWQASKLIDALAKNGWKKPKPPDVPF